MKNFKLKNGIIAICVCAMLFIMGAISMMAADPEGYQVSGFLSSFGAEEEATNMVLIPKGRKASTHNINVTGLSSEYCFNDVPKGEYTMIASKVGHATREYKVSVNGGDVSQYVEICLLGDANQDGKLDTKDLSVMHEYITKSTTLDNYQLKICDLNEDGKINITDETMLYTQIQGHKNPTPAAYTVNHYKLDEARKIIASETETLRGSAGYKTNAYARNYEGYEPEDFEQKKIEKDGSTVIDIYYKKTEIHTGVVLAGLTEDGKTLIFDDTFTMDEHPGYSQVWTTASKGWKGTYDSPNTSIKKAEIKKGFKLPTDASSYFIEMRGLETIEGLDKVDTSQVKDMKCMFSECISLLDLNVSSFDISQVTNMSLMFNGCSSLIKLDLSSFIISKTVDMSYMFADDINLEHIYVSDKWNRDHVDGFDMFKNAFKLPNYNSEYIDQRKAYAGGIGLGYLEFK